MSELLIVDSDIAFAKALAVDISARGIPADHCQTLARGMAMLHIGDYRCVLLGDNLPDGDSMEFLPEIREIPSRPEVIMMAEVGDPNMAEESITMGAWAYVVKPLNMQRLLVLLTRIRDYHKERRIPRPVALKREGIIGNGRAMQNCLDHVAQAASVESNVLIIGETGTGKELFARAVHHNSRRASKPFVVVDCAALPDTLVESVLFGHEKGAFTSADTKSLGLINQANGGTLFLDEIGELPLSIQKVFLRVLEGHRFRPVGGAMELSSDFRLVAATNRDLEDMVDRNEFRQDLYYRLRGIHITLPPLRTIPEDINELICHYIRTHSKRLRINSKGFSPDFLDALIQYDWPGNIRELTNAIEQALSVAGDEHILYPRHLPRTIRAQVARRAIEREKTPCSRPNTLTSINITQFPNLKDFRKQHLGKLETTYLQQLMDVVNQDIHLACDISGLSRARFYALLKKHGLHRE